MSMMMSFAWAGVMILIGMVLRAKVRFLSSILVPASVIGGLLGFVLMNLYPPPMATSQMFTQIVGHLFTISFISIGLTAPAPSESGSTTKNLLQGSMGMGFTWAVLYGLTPLIGYFILKLGIGKMFGMDPIYGLLIPFAFCQGPGQSAVFGGLVERAGWTAASQVAITYATIGFLIAFLVGVPMAKWGLKRGMASHSENLDEDVMKGIYPAERQLASAGSITTYNGNVDVLGFHFALVGICFIGAVGIGHLMAMVPNIFFQTFASMTFFNGMIVAYVVRWLLVKLNLKQYHDDTLQARITGFSTDFLICAAFMAIQVTVVGRWMLPILSVCLIVGVISYFVCVYFGERIGGGNDFERTLGLFGSATGTCPTGVALIRIVDPNLKTTAPAEMGAMNVFMLPSYLVAPTIIAFSGGGVSFTKLAVVCLVTSIAMLVCLKVFRVWGKPTYSLHKGISHKDFIN